MSDDKTDENPFSFMHFVKNKKEGLDDPDVDNKSGSRPQQPRSDEVNVNELPFPEVGETGVKKRTKGKDAKKSSHVKEKQLEASNELENNNPFSFKNFVKKDAALKTGGRVLQIIDDEICEVENSVDTVQITTNSEPASKIDIEDDYPKDDFTPLQAANSGEIVELKEENEQLKRQLMDLKKLKDLETARAESLVKKLKEMQQKENEETAALEKMVHMVEKNLELTTQRAAKGEATNVKLKEENKMLKSNSVSKAIYDDLVNKHQNYISSIKEQALSVSQHLDATAKKAEESLRQLHSGADALKLASQLLTSIDKFTNLHDDVDKGD